MAERAMAAIGALDNKSRRFMISLKNYLFNFVNQG